MNKHTPGPWRTTGSLISNESRVLIASLSGASDDSSEAANARLIAAAPELLEALKLFVNGQSKADFDAAHDAARAAIAKATGE